jgi:hypothetical protein
VPHTGYLLGSMQLKLRRAERVLPGRRQYLLQSLLAAPAQMPPSMPPRCCMLQARPVLMQRPGLTPQAILQINAVPAIWFDAHHPKYGGAYRVSPQAFPGLPKVRTVSLAPQGALGQEQRHWLCFLPNIITWWRAAANSEEAQRNLHGLMSSAAHHAGAGGQPACTAGDEFHPVDEANLNPQFKQQFYGFGLSYASFAAQQAIDAQLEPALFDFTRFIVINESAASRYVELFQGLDLLISLNLF